MKSESYDGRENNGVALPSGIRDALAEAGFEQPGVSQVLTDEQRKILATIRLWYDYALEYQIARERNTLLEQRIAELEQLLLQSREAFSAVCGTQIFEHWVDEALMSHRQLAAMRTKIEEIRRVTLDDQVAQGSDTRDWLLEKLDAILEAGETT